MDILSDLPGDIINAILRYLPLRDAVRTSIISKTWRYKWCTLAELTLDETDLGTVDEDSISLTFKFTNMLYRLFTLHSGPITKFTLTFYELETCPNIDNLIYFLSRKDIKHLVLKLSRRYRYKLPCSIFRCSQMRHLFLHGCLIPLPDPSFKGFDWLHTLKLWGVTISSNFLESLISHCPLLQHLTLISVNISKVIIINAPKLRFFQFFGNIASIRVENSPLLANLVLQNINSFSLDERKCDLAKFLEPFSALKFLNLDNGLELLATGKGEVPRRLSFDLNCLLEVTLWIDPDNLDTVSSALCLMRSSPCLEYIEIKAIRNSDENDPVQESLEAKWFSDMTFNHLREVMLRLGEGSNVVMQLIKFILAKSPVLVRMVIEIWLEDDQYEYLREAIKVSSVLNSFKRASPNAEVVYRIFTYRDGMEIK